MHFFGKTFGGKIVRGPQARGVYRKSGSNARSGGGGGGEGRRNLIPPIISFQTGIGISRIVSKLAPVVSLDRGGRAADVSNANLTKELVKFIRVSELLHVLVYC